jgi:hypothetical protein
MRADIFPDLNLPVIYVAQPYGGMSPAQMEGYLVYYYEYHFLYINGIQSVESKSIQNTGLLDSMNALQQIIMQYQRPIVMMVGLLGHESDAAPARSTKASVGVVTPILDAMGIEHEFLHRAGDEQRIAPAIERAYANSKPIALLIGRSPI